MVIIALFYVHGQSASLVHTWKLYMPYSMTLYRVCCIFCDILFYNLFFLTYTTYESI